MKFLQFFGDRNPVLPQNVCIHIFNFLDSESLEVASELNEQWKEIAEKVKRKRALLSPLLPIMNRIELLSSYSFDQIDIVQLAGGMTNRTFKLETTKPQLRYGMDKFKLEVNKWVFRVPGDGTSQYINRADERQHAIQASELGLNVQVVFFDGHDGLQLSRFLENGRSVTQEILGDRMIIPTIAHILKQLHTSPLFPDQTLDPFVRNTKLLDSVRAKTPAILPEDIIQLISVMGRIELLFKRYQYNLAACHNDTILGNFLVKQSEHEQQVKLIDWEYSKNNDPIWDLAYFALDAPLTRDQEIILLSSYFGGDCNVAMLDWFDLYKPVIAWWNAVWSWVQIANHADAVDEETYRKYATTYYTQVKEIVGSMAFEHALKRLTDYADSAFVVTDDAVGASSALIPRPF